MKFLKKLGVLLSTLLVLFVLVEFVLRIMGYEAHQPNQYRVESSPSLCITSSSIYGFALKPGKFSISINEHVKYKATHTLDSNRVVRRATESSSDTLPKVHVHGCSFTHGWGIDDSLTFSWKLQGAFPEWNITNYGVPGFGTVQSLLRLKQEIREGNKPDLAIFIYGAFHEERNVLTLKQRRAWHEGTSLTYNEPKSSAKYSLNKKIFASKKSCITSV